MENIKLNTSVSTNVKILVDGQVAVDKSNAIHPANMTTVIARGLSNADKHQIFKIKFGNQGTFVNPDQQIIFKPPITTGATADLYNPTYVEIVDDSNANVGSGNSVTFTQIPNSTSTRVIVTCELSANEANNRATDTADSSTTDRLDGLTDVGTESQYFFDELGIFSEGVGTDQLNDVDELMLTHLIFSPLEKTASRQIIIVYTLTITVTGS
jgi:hypothetical protein